jgi:hypothetical protein
VLVGLVNSRAVNCYEWRHSFSLTGMSISAEISYLDEFGLQVTISGTQTYPDVGPPYTRRGMRCGQGYDGFFARRNGLEGYERFFLTTFIQTNNGYPLTVNLEGTPIATAAVFDSALDQFAIFPSGMFKPENSSDPFYECGFGIWTVSTGVTKGFVRIIDDAAQLLAYGWFDRIGPGEVITYYKPDDFELTTPVGTGTLNYTFTTA